MDKKVLNAFAELAKILFEIIEDSGKQGIPSGHLYSMLIGKISLENYNTIINVLKKANKIKESNFLLTAI